MHRGALTWEDPEPLYVIRREPQQYTSSPTVPELDAHDIIADQGIEADDMPLTVGPWGEDPHASLGLSSVPFGAVAMPDAEDLIDGELLQEPRDDSDVGVSAGTDAEAPVPRDIPKLRARSRQPAQLSGFDPPMTEEADPEASAPRFRLGSVSSAAASGGKSLRLPPERYAEDAPDAGPPLTRSSRVSSTAAGRSARASGAVVPGTGEDQSRGRPLARVPRVQQPLATDAMQQRPLLSTQQPAQLPRVARAQNVSMSGSTAMPLFDARLTGPARRVPGVTVASDVSTASTPTSSGLHDTRHAVANGHSRGTNGHAPTSSVPTGFSLHDAPRQVTQAPARTRALPDVAEESFTLVPIANGSADHHPQRGMLRHASTNGGEGRVVQLQPAAAVPVSRPQATHRRRDPVATSASVGSAPYQVAPLALDVFSTTSSSAGPVRATASMPSLTAGTNPVTHVPTTLGTLGAMTQLLHPRPAVAKSAPSVYQEPQTTHADGHVCTNPAHNHGPPRAAAAAAGATTQQQPATSGAGAAPAGPTTRQPTVAPTAATSSPAVSVGGAPQPQQPQQPRPRRRLGGRLATPLSAAAAPTIEDAAEDGGKGGAARAKPRQVVTFRGGEDVDEDGPPARPATRTPATRASAQPVAASARARAVEEDADDRAATRRPAGDGSRAGGRSGASGPAGADHDGPSQRPPRSKPSTPSGARSGAAADRDDDAEPRPADAREHRPRRAHATAATSAQAGNDRPSTRDTTTPTTRQRDAAPEGERIARSEKPGTPTGEREHRGLLPRTITFRGGGDVEPDDND
jgi:hypothetical protein